MLKYPYITSTDEIAQSSCKLAQLTFPLPDIITYQSVDSRNSEQWHD